MDNAETKKVIHSIKAWLWLVAPVVFFIEFLHFLLRGNTKFLNQYFGYSDWTHHLFGLSTVTVLPAIFIIFSGAISIKKHILLAAVFLGTFFSWILVVDGFNTEWIDVSVSIFIPLGVFVALASGKGLLFGSRRQGANVEWAALYWYVLLLSIFLAVGITSFLEITPVIFPGTYDYIMHHLDAAYGYPVQEVAVYVKNSKEGAKDFLGFVYSSLGWVFLPMIALVIREGKSEGLHIWRFYILSLGLAMFCYAFIPVSGPVYAFGPKIFPDYMGGLRVPAEVATIMPALRNGMPSMHFTSAVSIALICAALRKKIYFVAALFFVVGTFFATIAFGEHYLIDIVVALTYSVTMTVLLVAPRRYLSQGRLAAGLLWLSGVSFLGWMLLFKFGSNWLLDNIWFIRVFTLWSVLLFLGVSAFFIRVVWRMPSDEVSAAPFSRAPSPLPADLKGNYWTIGVFFASGVAGLIYEVVFAKALAVTFGASSLATSTVLATYMGGMALGAWAGSRLAERSSNPLRLYAFCEAFIGLYALLTPTLFQLIQRIYIDLVLDRPADAPELTILRLALGGAILGPVTLLMGATFPIMFARLRQLGIASDRAIAPLYAANVTGAAFGALFAGYALIPAVGKNSATYIAALMSLLIALYSLEKIKNQPWGILKVTANKPKTPVSHVVTPVGIVALIVLAAGGAVTMGLEVLFMHMLAIIAGNSVYAFGLMLATFLSGLGIGSAVGERAVVKFGRERVVILAQCGLGVSIVISSLQWDSLAGYFSHFGAYEASGVHITFSGREAIRALVCGVAMIPSAFFIGMSYPACMGLATDWLGRGGREVSALGKASGVNTIGNISGVLLAGFWLLPIFGSRNALLILTITALTSGALMAIASFMSPSAGTGWRMRFTGSLAPLTATFGFIGLFPSNWNLDKLSEGANVYFYAQEWGTVIDHAESAEGGLTTVTRSKDGTLTLLTNGKFQGNNSERGEMIAQKSFALIPMLHTSQRETALVIGYGTGMTPRIAYENGFKSLDIAELSEDMVRLADRHFGNINHAVTSKPGVSTYFTDGRNFLLTQSKKYDLISIEISSIWFAGAANLYNKEFYELVSRRLTDKGVLQQWIQLHHMQSLDLLYALQSLRSAFKYVWFYVSGGQGIVVASNNLENYPVEMHKKTLEKTMQDSDLSTEELRRRLLAEPQQIDAMLLHFDPSMRALVSTDNNLYLEYATPKGNSLRHDTVARNLKLLTAQYPLTTTPQANTLH